MKIKLLPVQQGEVLLLPIQKLPETGKTRRVKSQIVALSESHHHHVLESKQQFEVMTDTEKNGLYLRLFEPAKLVHQKTFDKHRTLPVKPGVYKVLHKVEYDPFEAVIKQVRD